MRTAGLRTPLLMQLQSHHFTFTKIKQCSRIHAQVNPLWEKLPDLKSIFLLRRSHILSYSSLFITEETSKTRCSWTSKDNVARPQQSLPLLPPPGPPLATTSQRHSTWRAKFLAAGNSLTVEPYLLTSFGNVMKEGGAQVGIVPPSLRHCMF